LLHLTKLAVGIRDIAHLRDVQAERARQDPPLRHRTRNFPRRAQEVLDGGSLYWVIQGATIVRQRILDIVEDRWNDATACAGIVLDPTLVPLATRLTRPFQGWRYLSPAAAPLDLAEAAQADGEAELPLSLRKALRELGLL
jgi:hypothetical protein